MLLNGLWQVSWDIETTVSMFLRQRHCAGSRVLVGGACGAGDAGAARDIAWLPLGETLNRDGKGLCPCCSAMVPAHVASTMPL